MKEDFSNILRLSEVNTPTNLHRNLSLKPSPQLLLPPIHPSPIRSGFGWKIFAKEGKGFGFNRKEAREELRLRCFRPLLTLDTFAAIESVTPKGVLQRGSLLYLGVILCA
jgi:hypothetical protein